VEQKLKATERDGKSGKGAARKIRASGRVPGILYGHGMDPVSLAIDSRDLFHVLHTDAGTNVLIDLQVGSDHHLAMPREIQRDHIKGQFLHVDFLVVRRDEKITVDVPVSLIGESHGVKEGGVIEHHLWELKVECFPTDVPEAIEADVSRLGIGDALRVEDIMPPEGATILTDSSETIVSVVPPPVLAVEEEVAVSEEAEAEAEGATAEEAEQRAEAAGEEGGAPEGGGESEAGA
jgi:large subunit ribosomal protein L25